MVTQNKYTNKPIADYKAGKISKEEAAGKVRNIYRGGGGSSSSQVKAAEERGRQAAAAEKAAEAAKATAEAAKKAAAEAAVKAAALAATRTQQALRNQDLSRISNASGSVEKNRIIREMNARIESERIDKQRANLVSSGGRVDIQNLKDADTGADIKLTTTYSKNDATGGTRVFKKENLLTGEKSITTYEKDKGRTRRTGGINYTENKKDETYQEYKGDNVIFSTPAPDRTGQIYDSKTNMFLASPYGMGAGGTAIMTPPTIAEQAKIDAANLRGDSVAAVPAQYLGTIFNKEISEDLAKKGSSGNIIQRAGTFLNPKYQYDIAKYNENLKIDMKEVKNLNSRMELANKNLESGKIGTSEYNAIVRSYQNNPAVKRLENSGTNTMQAIADSSLSSKQKTALAGTVRVAQTVPYFIPATRAILGVDMVREGSQAYQSAETTQEKLMAGGSVALGGILAYSGASGMVGGTGATVTGTANQLKVLKTATYGSGIALGGSLGAVDYYSTLAQTGDKSTALGAALGTGGTIITGMVAPKVYEKGVDLWRTRNLERIETPGIGDKPFVRSTRGGTNELVFYERAGEAKWWNPKTYKYKGYKPGQLYKRQYRIVDPLVEGKTKGLSEVSYSKVVDGKVVKVTEPTTSFPYDKPESHLEWFGGKTEGVKQYYIPKKYSKPGETEGFGYSATPNKWKETPELDAYQKYYSGKGGSVYFFREGSESSAVQLGGKVDARGKPLLYASYFEKVKVNPASGETTVPNPMGGEKGWKQYSLSKSSEPGTLNLPVMKQEVEGVVSGTRTDLKSGYYFKFSDRKIPIQEGVYNLGAGEIPGTGKAGAASSGSSYIPTESYTPLPTVSAVSYSGYSSSNVVSPSTIISSASSSAKSSSPSIISYSAPSSSSNKSSGSSAIQKSSSPVSSTSSSDSFVSKPSSPISRTSSGTSNIYNPSKYTYRPSPPITPRVDGGGKTKAQKTIKDLFDVFIRKNKQDVFIGSEKTEYLAGRKLKKKLKSDLSASGFVQTEGKKISAKRFSGYDWGISKVDPFRVVQKAGGKFGGSGRLSTGSEVWDIQSRPKKQSRKKQKSNWLS